MNNQPILSAINNSQLIFLNCTSDGIILSVSQGVAGVFQYSPDYFKGKSVFSFLNHREAEEIRQACKKVRKNNQPVAFLFSLNFLDREKLELSISLEYSQEKGYSCVIMPLTENRDSNESNFRQMEVMRTTLETMDDFVFVLDKNGLFSEFYANNNARLFSGFSPGFREGSKLEDAGFPPEVVDLFLQTIRKVENQRHTEQINYSLKAFGGQLHYQARISPRFNLKGQFDGVTVVVRDISQLVKSENKLKQSLDYYLKVLDDFPTLIWRANTRKKFDYFNKTWLTFTGKSLEDEMGEGWQKSIHPDDREHVIQQFERNFAQKEYFILEYRLRHQNGSYRWIKNFCQPHFGINGEFNGYMGSCFDIHDIRTTQKLLQESEERYRTMVQTQNDLVVRWKPDLTINFVNTSYCNFFGKSFHQLMGKRWIEQLYPAEKKRVWDHLIQLKDSRKSHVFEFEIHDKLRKKFVYQWLTSPILDKVGRVVEYQSVGRDITDTINKEKENKNLLVHLNEKVKELSLLNTISFYINNGTTKIALLKNLAEDFRQSCWVAEDVFVRIEYNSRVYKSKNYRIPEVHSETIHEFGYSDRGRIVVIRDKGKTANPIPEVIYEGEVVLLDTVCEMLNSYFMKLETEQKLVESEQRYRELFDNVLDIVFSMDGEGRLLRTNNAANKILGYSSLEGRSFWDLIAPSEKPEHYKNLNNILARGQKSFILETKIFSSEGNIRFLELNCIVKYNEDRSVNEIFGIARDITEQKNLDKNHMKTIISTEEKERRRFAEELHDGIGPLLSGLKMYLEQDALEKNLSPRQSQVLSFCRQLVDDAIHQTRSISNNLTPGILNDFGLKKALESHVDKIKEVAGFEIDLNIQNPLDQAGNDEALNVFRVTSELLNNSIKHAQCTRVEIALDIKCNVLSLIYTDNGKGFNPSDAKFVKDSSKMGLGNIYNRINSLNGSVSFSSKPGEGMFARIFLPV